MPDQTDRHDFRHQRLTLLVILLVGSLVAWFIYWIAVVMLFPDSNGSSAARGQFGDMFGAVNALFSAFAFAGLIYTIVLQREELRLQRVELELTRDELFRTAEGHALKEVYDYVRRTHPQRALIFQTAEVIKSVRSDRDLEFFKRHEHDLCEAIREVSNCYHYIGFLSINGILTRKDAIFAEGGETMQRVWNIVHGFLELERKVRFPTYKQYFDSLVSDYQSWRLNSPEIDGGDGEHAV